MGLIEDRTILTPESVIQYMAFRWPWLKMSNWIFIFFNQQIVMNNCSMTTSLGLLNCNSLIRKTDAFMMACWGKVKDQVTFFNS